MINLKEELKKRYSKLPREIQQTLFSSDVSETINRIAERNSLTDEQEIKLETEVVNVFFAFEHYSDLIENIHRELAIDLSKAQKVGQEINSEVFRPIKQALRIAHGTIEGEFTPPKISVPSLSVVPEPFSPPPPPPPKPPTIIESLKPADNKLQVTSYALQDKEENLNREEILAGIENPVPTKPTDNIVQNKLSGMVRMPKLETNLPKDYPTDPYREPTN